MRLVVKQARPADSVALAEILTQAVRYKISHDDHVWGSKPYSEKEVQKSIQKGHAYAAWLDDRLIATLMLLWEDEMIWGKQPPNAAYVHQLAIRDGYRGKGIGKKLLNWASKQAAKNGRKLLRIDIPPDNAGLKAYYEKQGFHWVRDRLVHAPHATYTAVLYERPVVVESKI